MPSLKERVTAFLDRARARSRLLDHVIRTQQHYSAVKGNLQAGAVTYFAFLSFFPILALAFFVVGCVARVYPDGAEEPRRRHQPGAAGAGRPRTRTRSRSTTIQDAAGTVGLIGLVALLYSGLGWLSGMRDALTVVFEEPRDAAPGFLIGKLRDLVTLAVIGVIADRSASPSRVWSPASPRSSSTGSASASDLALAARAARRRRRRCWPTCCSSSRSSSCWPSPALPARSLWSGALLGAVGFEVLKRLSRS